MKHTITLIRHGMTEGNLKRIYTGQTNVPLCPQGVDGIKAKSGQYPECDLLIVSDLIRTQQTASIIYPGMEQIVVGNIRECNMGDFEGKTYDELKDNPDYQRFLDVNDGYVPGGECKNEFHERCIKGFNEVIDIIEKKGAKRAAVVSHGGVIMELMNHFSEGITVFYDYQTKNGGGYIISYDTDAEKIEILGKLE